MKNLILGIALVLIFSLFSVYQSDSNRLSEHKEALKYAADEAAATAGLFYRQEEYAEGRKVFDDEKANEKLRSVTRKNLKLDEEMKPLEGGYWTDKLHYEVVYFDDSLKKRVYKDGNYISTESFSYGDVFEDVTCGYIKVITEPAVAVMFHAGKPGMRLPFLKDIVTVSETSLYEYVGY